MGSVFNSLKERIELGHRHQIPVESKLIMLGEIIYAAGRGDLIPKEARELENLLGLRQVVQNYDAVREQGFFGELVEDMAE
ncbi:hypothetical protein [[Phormidium] sp. ETS-05]|uniref:hypothetical protein n=1 Tax=[Phormidium] sp. ETS-05 TaxID=222819 RepID=UPI0018EF22E1|nr:hypothetical protein [[Phormidium] sp. ETS-05]